jgi:hypothetical protein
MTSTAATAQPERASGGQRPRGRLRALRGPAICGAATGALQAASPLAFWWLEPRTVYALGLVLIAAVYIGFSVADGRWYVIAIAIESSVAGIFVVVDVVVIGGGQAGLAMAWHLARQHLRFVVLEAGPEPGHMWRSRWDSLILFTPAQYDALPGMPFPGPPGTYPAKEQVADYLNAYAAEFNLPVRLNTRVTALIRTAEGFEARTDDGVFRARQVVVATGPFQVDRPDVIIGSSRRRLRSAGVRFRPAVADAEGRTVLFADGTSLNASIVIWTTGYRSDYSWIHIPGLAGDGQVIHRRGVTDVPGLYFLGLPWQHSRGSALLGFVHDAAAYLAGRITSRAPGQAARPARFSAA